MGKNKAKNAGTKNQQKTPNNKKSNNTAMKEAVEKAMPDFNKIVHGTVKWFNTVKGYGFITADDGTEYFFHQTNITKGRPITVQDLHTDDVVTFKLFNGEKGVNAVDVKLIKDEKKEAAEAEEPTESEEAESEDENDEPADEAE